MKTNTLMAFLASLNAAASASECVLVGFYNSGEVSGGFATGSYSGNDVALYADGQMVWDYNDSHDGSNVAAICAGDNQPGDKCRHGVEYNGNTFYYSVDFEGISIQNCLVEWGGQGHWADQDSADCSVNNGYTYVGLGGGPTSSCGCKFSC